MLLMNTHAKVALVTTHLPLKDVTRHITTDNLLETLQIVHSSLIKQFGIAKPRMGVCGLNPHAGEGGHLGREEIDIIIPVLQQLRHKGFDVLGPLPADTAFLPAQLASVDVIVAMYHDQGLPVVKQMDFANTVNVTLGLPFVRTSVDHGTALDLAGKKSADPSSFMAALKIAIELVE
jgi:4-hydroxythreonine-4-phosphate dehydrogenase